MSRELVHTFSSSFTRYEEKISQLQQPSNFEEDLLKQRLEAWNQASSNTINRKSTALEICSQWSRASDKILNQAFQKCFDVSKIALFALGKLGAEELNLSSDVDLILVAHDLEAQEKALKDLRKFQSLFQIGAYFLYRLDFNLRPGGRFSSVIGTLDQFIDYYGNYGETWERMALCRLRPLAGAQDLIQQILLFRKKFSYRKHIDYTIFDDFAILRGKIHADTQKREDKNLLNLKFSSGGIRDIELFLHSMQVAHGGRSPALQTHLTNEIFTALEDLNLFSSEDLSCLREHYWLLRELENYSQALRDEHTHSIHLNDSHPHWVRDELRTLSAKLEMNAQLISKFIKPPDRETKIERPNAPNEALDEILQLDLFSRNKERDLHYRNLFVQDFLSFTDSEKRNKATHNLLNFLRSTKAKSSFFSMFAREKKISELLALIFSGSDYLSMILQNRPELLDSIFLKQQALDSSRGDQFYESLVEKKLLTELLLGVDFLKQKEQEESIYKRLSANADEIGRALLQHLKSEFKDDDLEILCLGKWGGQELGFHSDLDFIFICQNEPSQTTHKIARRFISRLTEAHRGGSIYEIDTRLKPSGKGGPLICSWEQLINYIQAAAEPWELQAYLKARLLPTEDSKKFNVKVIPQTILSRTLTKDDWSRLNDIRKKLISAKSIKYKEGGLVDIELAVQSALLNQKLIPDGTHTLRWVEQLGENNTEWNKLGIIYAQLRSLEQKEKLRLDQNLERIEHLNSENSLLSASLLALVHLDPRRTSG